MTGFQLASIAAIVFSGLCLIIGFVWIMVGRARWQRDDQAVPTLMSEEIDADTLVEPTVFQGKAPSVSGGYEVSFGEIVKMLREGRFYEAAPILLAFIGLFGILWSIGLILLAFHQTIVGAIMLAVAAYTMAQAACSFCRSSKQQNSDDA
ncbi:MAG TPA: hypothetical protein G4O02_13680 [Caldilineae bacterium]|nr:hypothetical protein [Caldilineae bacterium]